MDHEIKDIQDLVKEYARLEVQALQVKTRQMQIMADINEILQDIAKQK